MKTKLSNLRCYLVALLAAIAMSATAQVTVKGVVLDPATGESLIGASVIEKGTKNGATTGIDGDFSLKVSSADATLVVSYVG